MLLFGGLCLLADSLVVRRGAPAKPAAGWPGQDKVLAGLAGLALGLTILVRIDGLSDILPAVPFLGVLLAARRRQAIPFGAGLVIGVGYGLADGYLKSRPYLDLEAPSLRPLALIVAVVVLVTLAGVAVTASPAARAGPARLAAATGRCAGCPRGRGDSDRPHLRRLRHQAAGADGGRGDRPDLDRLRGRTAEARAPAHRRATAVLRGQPVLGDLVPRRARGAARRLRPRGSRPDGAPKRCSPGRIPARAARVWALPAA